MQSYKYGSISLYDLSFTIILVLIFSRCGLFHVSFIHASFCHSFYRSKVFGFHPYGLPCAFSPVWVLLCSCISRDKILLISDKAWAIMLLPLFWSDWCCINLLGWNHLQSSFLHFPLMKNLQTFRCSPLWQLFCLHPPSL